MDTPDRPSYGIGGDMNRIMTLFRVWKHFDLGCRAVDMARERGIAQAIIKDGRVVNLNAKRDMQHRPSVWAKPKSQSYNLPALG
jgi:hypothetical protein